MREIVLVDTDVASVGELWLRLVAEGFGARFFLDGQSALSHLL